LNNELGKDVEEVLVALLRQCHCWQEELRKITKINSIVGVLPAI